MRDIVLQQENFVLRGLIADFAQSSDEVAFGVARVPRPRVDGHDYPLAFERTVLPRFYPNFGHGFLCWNENVVHGIGHRR